MLYPPYAIHEEEAQYIADPAQEGAWDLRMFGSKHANGPDSLDFGKLTLNPGNGWPPHRHLAADEWLYVLSGEGGYAYYAFENNEPTELAVSTGHVLYNPQGQWHKVWNNGSAPLLLMVVSKALAPYEVLDDWPEAADGGAGYLPPVLPWEASCAPGHEAVEEQGDAGDGEQGQGQVEDDSGSITPGGEYDQPLVDDQAQEAVWPEGEGEGDAAEEL